MTTTIEKRKFRRDIHMLQPPALLSMLVDLHTLMFDKNSYGVPDRRRFKMMRDEVYGELTDRYWYDPHPENKKK